MIGEISKIHFEKTATIQNSSQQQPATLPDIPTLCRDVPFSRMHEDQGRDACTSLFGRFSNKAVSIFLSFLSRRMA